MPADKITKLYLASAHFLPANGGATIRFVNDCTNFLERSIHVQILTGSPKAKGVMCLGIEAHENTLTDAKVPLAPAKGELPVRRIRLPERAGWTRSIRFSRARLNFCRQPGYRPRVLQVISSFQPRSLPWILRLRKLGIKVVYAYTIATKIPTIPVKRIVRKWSSRALYKRGGCLLVSSYVTNDTR